MLDAQNVRRLLLSKHKLNGAAPHLHPFPFLFFFGLAKKKKNGNVNFEEGVYFFVPQTCPKFIYKFL